MASRLTETLTDHAFTVESAVNQAELIAALRSGKKYDVIVTGTALIGCIRETTATPIINYEVFVHDHPAGTATPLASQRYFDVNDFVVRVLFHLRNQIR